MRLVIVMLLSVAPAGLAWWGLQSGNNFLLGIGGLIALAPVTALVVSRNHLNPDSPAEA